MFQSVYASFVSAVLGIAKFLLPLNYFFHIIEGIFFLQTYSDALYFKIFHRALALRRISFHQQKDKSVLVGTLHLQEGKYYPLFSWKIPYVSSISLKRCDISYHCTTRMFLLGNAQTILMSMFIHQRKSFFSPCKTAKLFLI